MNRLSTNDDQFNALLGAYLDNEVTAQERQHVDRALHDDAGARTMLEDIRQLKSDVAGLPRLRLEPDFYQRVLRQAEREMVRGEDPPTVSLGTARPHSADRRRSFLGAFSTWPRVAAALLVLAPALALIVLATRPGDEGERQTLAQHKSPANQADGEEERDGAGRKDHRKEELLEAEGVFGGARSRVQPEADNSIGGGGGSVPGAPAPAKQALEPSPTDKLTVVPGVLVVHVAVTPEAWQTGEVRKLLAGNKALKYNELGDDQNEKPQDAAGGGQGKAGARGQPRPVRVVNIEAPSAKLQAMLAKLQAEAKAGRGVLALAVQPPSGTKTYDLWSTYNHGAGFFQMDRNQRLLSRAPGLEDKTSEDEENENKQELSRGKNNTPKKSLPEEPSKKQLSRSTGGQRTNDKPSANRGPPPADDRRSDKKGISQARALIIFYIQPTAASPDSNGTGAKPKSQPK